MTRRALLIEALAADQWGHVSTDEGLGPEIQHYCENDLEGPAILLERLGYVRALNDGMTHAFAPGWQPGHPPPFPASEPAPSDDNLADALLFLALWRDRPDNGSGLSAPMPLAPPPGAPPADPVARTFRDWTAARIAALLNEN